MPGTVAKRQHMWEESQGKTQQMLRKLGAAATSIADTSSVSTRDGLHSSGGQDSGSMSITLSLTPFPVHAIRKLLISRIVKIG